MMRMYLNTLEEELIEGDKRFSKANYSSKKNFSIETAILEKQLILDNSLLSLEKTMYNLTDLKSCCNRQLLNIESIVEESIRRNWNAINLFTKIIPVFQHYMWTGFGMSERAYEGEKQ